jgi:hypothetical protein
MHVDRLFDVVNIYGDIGRLGDLDTEFDSYERSGH